MNTSKMKSKKNRFSLTIKKRLILSFIFILLIPSISIGLISYSDAKQEIRNQIEISLEENVKILDNMLTNFISSKVADAGFFAENLSGNFNAETNLSSTIASFEQYKELNPDIVSIYAGSNKGDLVIFPEAELPADFDARTRPWYKGAEEKNGEVFITEPYLDAATGDTLITVAQRLKDNSGVIGIDLSLAALKDMTTGIKIGKKGYPFIVSAEGNYLVHPDEESGTKATGSWVKDVLEKEMDTLSYELNGTMKEMMFMTNSLTGMKIIGSMNIREITQAANPILVSTLIIVAIFILIGAAISYFVVRSITRPLNTLMLATDKVSEGDLTQKFDIKSNDEIGKLGESFNKMMASLQFLISQVREKADHLAAASEELTASSEQNNMATEQVASSIQEVASATEQQTNKVKESNIVVKEMSDRIQQIMKNSNIVAETASKTSEIVQNGNQAIELTSAQMSHISHTVKDLGEIIHTLGNRSSEIGQIINVISEIADQTNLLALNAAIEAARAGEHGRGFAVVAEEVRKLAEQSSKSTENIRELISSIQADTGKAIKSMDAGTDEFEKGIHLVGNAGEAFVHIQQFTETVSSQIKEVTSSIKELTDGAEQVVKIVNAIEQVSALTTAESQDVSAATEEQLASMEEIAASAVSLSNMAEELLESVKKFKVS